MSTYADLMAAAEQVQQMVKDAREYTTYFVGTLGLDDHHGLEDTERDLVKVGETKSRTPHKRLISASRMPEPMQPVLIATIKPWRDHWAHGIILDTDPDDDRYYAARKYGLETPHEWFRGGAEMKILHMALTLQKQGLVKVTEHRISLERREPRVPR
ncbi:hypothetical protein [Euzebya tangerina]|uniref:hypothetical protein n=1 Tax=Euzebya tangerina TaxID=591198 RepID=UPI000E30D526|nr:hypothetical protein [Euzebya tangerina]